MTVFQLSGDLFIKESQLGLNNGRRKKGGKSVWRQWREADRLWMSSLNITRWNKPAARIWPWRGAKLLMLLDASLLEPRRSSEHGEGKQDAENGLLLRVLAWGMLLWKYFKKIVFYTIRLFGGKKPGTYLDNDFRKTGVSEHLHPRLQRCIKSPTHLPIIPAAYLNHQISIQSYA